VFPEIRRPFTVSARLRRASVSAPRSASSRPWVVTFSQPGIPCVFMLTPLGAGDSAFWLGGTPTPVALKTVFFVYCPIWSKLIRVRFLSG